MEVIILIGAFQSAFFAVLVLSKKKKSVADKILAFWLSIFAIHFSFVYYSYLSGPEFYIEFGYIPSGVLIIYYTLMYVYTKSLVNKENVFNKKLLLHIIPTTITYLSIFPIARLSYSEKVKFATQSEPNLYINLVFAAVILITSIYLIATLSLLKKHRITIGNIFSYKEDIRLNWLRILAFLLVFLFIVISVLIASFYSTPAMLPEEHVKIDIYGQFSFVAFVCLLGYFGIKQQVIYSLPEIVNTKVSSTGEKGEASSSYQKSGLNKEDSIKFLNELQQLMKEEEPYLNEKLTLRDVSERMNISTNHLSQVINENLKQNFFDFINWYRVDLMKQKMSDLSYKKYTLLALAYECGFNSKSSFNGVFKKFTGHTPSQYLSQKNI